MKSAVRLITTSLALFAVLNLYAGIMRPLSIEELAGTANLIVQGVVTNEVCLRDGEGRIYTKVDLQISEVLKGSSVSNTLSVVHGGGTIGKERQEVSGQVEYVVGQEVVAFLVINPRGQPVTIGLCQGKFNVWQDKQTGEKFASNLFHGAPSAENLPSTPGQQAALKVQSPALLKLTDLRQQIQQAGK